MSDPTPFQNAVMDAFANRIAEAGGGIAECFMFVGQYIDANGRRAEMISSTAEGPLAVGLSRFLATDAELDMQQALAESYGIELCDPDEDD